MERAREPPGQGRDRGAEGEGHQLQPVDGHAHHLRGERVLAQRPPRAARAGLVDEAERDEDDDEEDQCDVEVGDVEDALVLRRQLPAEEAERVDVQDPVRAAREIVAEEAVPVRGHDVEELDEEQRDDGEVVAAEPPGGSPTR